MKVIQVSKTVGVGEWAAADTIDKLVVGKARVSTSKLPSGSLFEGTKGLIRFCALAQHWSVFDQARLGIEIITSRSIGRQILRHFSISPQEFSQRYSEVHSFEDIDIRMKGGTNRQGSTYSVSTIKQAEDGSFFSVTDATTPEKVKEAVAELRHSVEFSRLAYKQAIDAGIALESARFVLPEAATSKLHLDGSIRSWITFLNARLHQTAQKEVRDIAEAIRQIVIAEAPEISEAFFNFEADEDIHVLERLVLERYGVYQQVVAEKKERRLNAELQVMIDTVDDSSDPVAIASMVETIMAHKNNTKRNRK